MQNNKLFNILSYLERSEIVRCRKYINSPYFNNSESLSQLFEIFFQLVEQKAETIPKEKIWKKIFGKEEYDDVRFRKLCSDLLKIIEGFLAQQIYEENPIRQATHLIEAVARKRMSKLYNTAMKAARLLSERQMYLPATHYFYEYQIEKNYYDILTHQEKRISKTNFESIVNNLDRFYLAEKLKYYCSVLSRQYQVSHEYKLLFIDEIVNHLANYNYLDVPSISVYYQIFLTQTDGDNEEHYFKLKNLLDANSKYFQRDEAYEIYTYALNYCIRKSNFGAVEFLKEYFETYKVLLTKDIIEFEDEEHGPWHFKNIILASLRLGEYDWTERFIKDYKDKLPEELRENAVSFNMAQLYFYKKEYGKVIKYLHQVEYEDLTYNLNSKAFLIQTYYELDEIEPLYSLTESFRVYLQRNNKIAAQRSRNYLNFIKFVKKLTKILPGAKKDIDKFLSEISETKGIVGLEWLKKKAQELE
ncbi:MAG TPA: hypothetical protein VK590_15700 [Saprospiraceae bacterium]|nr:hypothetical protein [Saprospiraceae bacterium]